MRLAYVALLALVVAGCAAGSTSESERALDAAVQARIAAHPGDYSNGDARAVAVSRDGQVHGVIWGTMHTGYDDTTIPPATIRAKLDDAVDLTVETVYDNRTPEQSRQLLAPCRNAAHQADPAAFSALDPDVRAAVAELRLPSGKPEEFSLLALSYAVSAQSSELSRTGLPSGSSPDLVLTRTARDRHLPIHALERPEMQVAMLCSDPNGPIAAMLLRLAVRRRAYSSSIRQYIRASYSAGQVDRVLAAPYWLAGPQDIDALDRQRQQLLAARNGPMARRLARRLEEPGLHFVAIGAGHLIGDNGVVALLRRDGWTVAPCVNDRC